MKIFIVGASGYVATAVAAALQARGHSVSGLVRSAEKARLIAKNGVEPIVGDATELSSLADPVADADVTIISSNMAFDRETETVAPLLDRLAGSGKTFIFTSGTAVLSIDTPEGNWREESFAEDDPWTPVDRMRVRIRTEDLVRDAARRGIRAMVIRPPLIWGNGASNQIPAIFRSVAATGSACYLGSGLNCYSNVHVDDLAEVYALAIERGSAGALYHAVAGETAFRTLAEAVGEVMGCGTRSVTIEEACRIWGDREAPMYFGVSSRSRAPRTHSELGWQPRRLDLVDDIRKGSYRTAFAPAS